MCPELAAKRRQESSPARKRWVLVACEHQLRRSGRISFAPSGLACGSNSKPRADALGYGLAAASRL